MMKVTVEGSKSPLRQREMISRVTLHISDAQQKQLKGRQLSESLILEILTKKQERIVYSVLGDNHQHIKLAELRHNEELTVMRIGKIEKTIYENGGGTSRQRTSLIDNRYNLIELRKQIEQAEKDAKGIFPRYFRIVSAVEIKETASTSTETAKR